MAVNMDEFKKSEIYKTSINATVPNSNSKMSYFWMTNKKGVRVPVAPHNLKDALDRGYRHTDEVLHSDKAEDHYQFGQELKSNNPIDKLTNTLERFIGGQAPQANKEAAKEESKKAEKVAEIKKADV